LSFLYRGTEDDAPYFRGLLRALRLVRGARLALALAIYSEDYTGEATGRKINDHEAYLGLRAIPSQEIRNFARSFGADDIIYTSNHGLDYGPFFAVVKFLQPSGSVTKIHSKTNATWREGLVRACYMRPETGDVVVSRRWWTPYDDATDINAPNVQWLIARYLKNNQHPETFQYLSGSILTMPVELLGEVMENFVEIYGNLTGREKDDVFWRNAMAQDEASDALLRCPYNLPLSEDRHSRLISTQSRNYIELYDNGARGLNDGMIEHAWERYIGAKIAACGYTVRLV
jgi:hypothetical protein